MMCPRCEERPASDAYPCWWCVEDLCGPCWESVGHCGHPEAEAVNRASRMMTREQRRDLVLATIPEEERFP